MDGPYRAIPCACGHRACKNWHVSPVAQVQGVGFTKAQAEMVAKLLNEDHLRIQEQRMANAVTLAIRD